MRDDGLKRAWRAIVDCPPGEEDSTFVVYYGDFKDGVVSLISKREAKLLRKVKKIVKKPRGIWLHKGEVPGFDDEVAMHWDSLRKQIIEDLEEL